jgi:hypothetical protein
MRDRRSSSPRRRRTHSRRRRLCGGTDAGSSFLPPSRKRGRIVLRPIVVPRPPPTRALSSSPFCRRSWCSRRRDRTASRTSLSTLTLERRTDKHPPPRRNSSVLRLEDVARHRRARIGAEVRLEEGVRCFDDGGGRTGRLAGFGTVDLRAERTGASAGARRHQPCRCRGEERGTGEVGRRRR